MKKTPPKTLQIHNSTAEFLIFTSQAGENSIEVRVEEGSVWLTQKLIATLFDVDVRTVSEHLGNIFSSGELQEDSALRKFRITAADGKQYLTNFYNLDAIISVGYPPDMQLLATETVLKQAEMIADELTEKV